MVWFDNGMGMYYIPRPPPSPLLLLRLGILRVLLPPLRLLQLLLLAALVTHNLTRAEQGGDGVERRVIVVG